MLHHLFIALCAHHPKSNLIFSAYINIWPQLPFTPTLFPLVLSYYSLCLQVFICFSCLFTHFHMNEIIWFFIFSIWLILFSMIFLISTHVVENGSIFSYGWVVFHCKIYIITSLFNHLAKEGHFGCVHDLAVMCWNKHRSAYIFVNKYFQILG